MIDLKRACEQAKEQFHKNGMTDQITEVCDSGLSWIISGRYYENSKVEYGNNPIEINKETGEMSWFVLAIPENMKKYYDSKLIDVENI